MWKYIKWWWWLHYQMNKTTHRTSYLQQKFTYSNICLPLDICNLSYIHLNLQFFFWRQRPLTLNFVMWRAFHRSVIQDVKRPPYDRWTCHLNTASCTCVTEKGSEWWTDCLSAISDDFNGVYKLFYERGWLAI